MPVKKKRAKKKPLKLDVAFCFPSYGGNGGIAAEHPAIRSWFSRLLLAMSKDKRIGRVLELTENDTPITMIRNRFVKQCRDERVHLCIMVDSDQDPDLHHGQDWYKPFFWEAFNKIYDHYSQGPLVIGAPYCGPPGSGEGCYVFYWNDRGSHGEQTEYSLEMYPRQLAMQFSGIQEVGALPTGMIMYDMRIFDLLDDGRTSKMRALEDFKDGKIDRFETLRRMQDGYFYYEWKDTAATEKASTEDVSATRDMSIVGMAKLGYNPVMCAWDSWIGHFKPWCVGKPKLHSVEQVGGALSRTVLANISAYDRVVRVKNDVLIKALEKANGANT